MAPPQVDLGKKQPLEDVTGLGEKVGGNKLPPPQAAVAMETGTRRVAGRRLLGTRRCKLIIIGIVIGLVVMAGIATGVFFGVLRREREWRGKFEKDGYHGDEDIRPDGAKHVIHVTRDESGNFYPLRAVLDYDRQMAGFLDMSTNRCYIDALHESYEEGCQRWYDYKYHARRPMLRPMRVVNPALDVDVAQYFGGPEIAALCDGVPTYLVVELRGQPEFDDGPAGMPGMHSPDDHSQEEGQPDGPIPMPDGDGWYPPNTTPNTDSPPFDIVYL